jgi:hypothetical protein
MGTAGKVTIGALTILADVLSVSVGIVALVIFLSNAHYEGGSWFEHQPWAVFVLWGASFLLSAGLFVFYIVHVLRNGELSSNEKLLWALLVALVGWVGRPVYWWCFIYRTTPPARIRIA